MKILISVLLLTGLAVGQHVKASQADVATLNATTAANLSGTNSLANINNTQMCDQFSGATADVKINACIAALPAAGGIADARGLIGSQTVAAEIDVGGPAGSPTKFVNLILPCGANWSVTITGGATSAIKVFGASSVVTLMCAQNGGFKLNLAAAGNVASLVTNDQTCAACSIKLHGMLLGNGAGGTVANAMLDLSNLGNNAEISSVNITTFKGKGLWIHGSNSESVFTAVNSDGVYTSGNVPCTIETTSTSLETMRFYGLDCQHPAAGNKLLVINGHGAANLCCLTFLGSHFEGNNVDTTTPFVSVADAKMITFVSPFFNSLTSGTTNWGVNISQTASNLTDAITVINATCPNGNCINDAIRTLQVSGNGDLPFYSYSAANSVVPFLFSNGTVFSEVAAITNSNPTGVDTCYGDSTAHAIKCNYNNVGSFNQTQTIASGTAVMTTSLIASAACGSVVTVTATGAATTDTIVVNPNASTPTPNYNLTVQAWPTSNNVNFEYCNPTAGGLTPAALTLNWKVVR